MVARNLSRHYCRRSGIKRKKPDSSPALTSGRGTTGTAMQICEEIGIQQNFFRFRLFRGEDESVF